MNATEYRALQEKLDKIAQPIQEEPANNTFTVDTDRIDDVDVMKINEIIADYMNQEHPDLPADAGFSYSIVVDVD